MFWNYKTNYWFKKQDFLILLKKYFYTFKIVDIVFLNLDIYDKNFDKNFLKNIVIIKSYTYF